MHKIKVYLDSLMMDTPLPAWTEGARWNGWLAPYFESEAARTLLLLHRCQFGKDSAWYDEKRDQFCFLLDGEQAPECYGAVVTPINGTPTALYPIGASSWIWDEWSPLN